MEKYVEKLIIKASEEKDCNASMKFAQAALNLSQAITQIKYIKNNK